MLLSIKKKEKMVKGFIKILLIQKYEHDDTTKVFKINRLLDFEYGFEYKIVFLSLAFMKILFQRLLINIQHVVDDVKNMNPIFLASPFLRSKILFHSG